MHSHLVPLLTLSSSTPADIATKQMAADTISKIETLNLQRTQSTSEHLRFGAQSPRASHGFSQQLLAGTRDGLCTRIGFGAVGTFRNPAYHKRCYTLTSGGS
jgi:hypothetical protein